MVSQIMSRGMGPQGKSIPRLLTKPQRIEKPKAIRRFHKVLEPVINIAKGDPPKLGLAVAPFPKTVYDKSAYRPGTVFSTAMHEHDKDQRFMPGSPCQAMTSVGLVYSKYRKFVVIAAYGAHCLSLPIYTHGDRGLKCKPNKHEYISIRDWDRRHLAAPAESHHGLLWSEPYPSLRSNPRGWHRMPNTASIQLTSPYTHKYGTESQILGDLTPESTEKLVELFNAGMREPEKLLLDQHCDLTKPLKEPCPPFSYNGLVSSTENPSDKDIYHIPRQESMAKRC